MNTSIHVDLSRLVIEASAILDDAGIETHVRVVPLEEKSAKIYGLTARSYVLKSPYSAQNGLRCPHAIDPQSTYAHVDIIAVPDIHSQAVGMGSIRFVNFSALFIAASAKSPEFRDRLDTFRNYYQKNPQQLADDIVF